MPGAGVILDALDHLAALTVSLFVSARTVHREQQPERFQPAYRAR
jgi:hypothetical protein